MTTDPLKRPPFGVQMYEIAREKMKCFAEFEVAVLELSSSWDRAGVCEKRPDGADRVGVAVNPQQGLHCCC